MRTWSWKIVEAKASEIIPAVHVSMEESLSLIVPLRETTGVAVSRFSGGWTTETYQARKSHREWSFQACGSYSKAKTYWRKLIQTDSNWFVPVKKISKIRSNELVDVCFRKLPFPFKPQPEDIYPTRKHWIELYCTVWDQKAFLLYFLASTRLTYCNTNIEHRTSWWCKVQYHSPKSSPWPWWILKVTRWYHHHHQPTNTTRNAEQAHPRHFLRQK